MVKPCLLRDADYAGGTEMVRFSMVIMWLFYAGWLAKMLFHNPEYEFCRVGRPEHEAEHMGFGWEKFKWAMSLLFSWRGVGWNFKPRKLPPPRKLVGRWRFVVRQLVRAAAYRIATDAAMAFYQRWHIRTGDQSLADLNWCVRGLLVSAIGASVWWLHEYQFAVYGALLVATGISKEEACLESSIPP